jgi:hypothetical protein
MLGALPPVVSIEMPSMTTTDGKAIPTTTLKCKASIDVRDLVMVELDEAMLYYIKHAMLNSFKDDRVAPDRRNNGVRWRVGRKCWSARRQSATDPEQFITKSFKPQTDDPISVREAADDAAAWVGGQDEGDDLGDTGDPSDSAQETSDGVRSSCGSPSATALESGTDASDISTDTPTLSAIEVTQSD